MNPIWFFSFSSSGPWSSSSPSQGHHLPDPSAHNFQWCHTVGGSVQEHTRGCEDAPHVTASETAQEGARHQEDHQPMQTQQVPYMLDWWYICDYGIILVNIQALVHVTVKHSPILTLWNTSCSYTWNGKWTKYLDITLPFWVTRVFAMVKYSSAVCKLTLSMRHAGKLKV